MSDVSVNNLKPSEVGPEMVAYMLAVSILAGKDYSKGYSPSGAGIPVLNGFSKEDILSTYADALHTVRTGKIR